VDNISKGLRQISFQKFKTKLKYLQRSQGVRFSCTGHVAIKFTGRLTQLMYAEFHWLDVSQSLKYYYIQLYSPLLLEKKTPGKRKSNKQQK